MGKAMGPEGDMRKADGTGVAKVQTSISDFHFLSTALHALSLFCFASRTTSTRTTRSLSPVSDDAERVHIISHGLLALLTVPSLTLIAYHLIVFYSQGRYPGSPIQGRQGFRCRSPRPLEGEEGEAPIVNYSRSRCFFHPPLFFPPFVGKPPPFPSFPAPSLLFTTVAFFGDPFVCSGMGWMETLVSCFASKTREKTCPNIFSSPPPFSFRRWECRDSV